ncbi:hypothetical protein E8E13_001939 [Curvularia kusanoi]|uniref:F-box domain-containing protein n=1 Tax=Curvularia kusanoi TaxID=90978 RepID=A0A9P4T5E7_CURKU|nr:hypothetical protein E8E13_001939 [Curvularia kusanoi]
MSSNNSSSPWRGLPDELKTMILEYALRMDQPCHLMSWSFLGPFLLTSKRMSELALEVWGKNRLCRVLRPTAKEMPYISPNIGRHIRNLSIHFRLPDSIMWNDIDSSIKFATGKGTPWRVLLSCKNHRTSPLSSWQLTLPNLLDLRLQLWVESLHGGYHWYSSMIPMIAKHYDNIDEFLATSACDLRAESVTLNVTVVGCGRYSTGTNDHPTQHSECAKKIAEGIKALIENKKMVKKRQRRSDSLGSLHQED